MAASESEIDFSLAKVLRVLSDCVELFLKARADGRIQFGPGQVTMAAAEMSRILVAAAANPRIARQLILYAPTRCEQQIAAIQQRGGLLGLEDIGNHFAAWCECSGPEMLQSPTRIGDTSLAFENYLPGSEKEGQGS